jgi:hypothetical protein
MFYQAFRCDSKKLMRVHLAFDLTGFQSLGSKTDSANYREFQESGFIDQPNRMKFT